MCITIKDMFTQYGQHHDHEPEQLKSYVIDQELDVVIFYIKRQTAELLILKIKIYSFCHIVVIKQL